MFIGEGFKSRFTNTNLELTKEKSKDRKRKIERKR